MRKSFEIFQKTDFFLCFVGKRVFSKYLLILKRYLKKLFFQLKARQKRIQVSDSIE